jgi:FKBP-type peptidyl-prolyl cis-trans isomerase SlyD
LCEPHCLSAIQPIDSYHDFDAADKSKENSMRSKLSPTAALLAVCLLAIVAVAAEKIPDSRVIKDGLLVSLHYTLKDTGGNVIESSSGKEPLRYVHGQKMLIPGLEKELTGMKVGGEKHVTVKPEEAYGPVNKEAFQELPKEKIPPEGQKVGAILTGQGPQGQPIKARVHEVKEKTVVVDFNHPMAGKTLVFDVTVVDIQPPPTPPAQPNAPGAASKPAPAQPPAKPSQPGQSK